MKGKPKLKLKPIRNGSPAQMNSETLLGPSPIAQAQAQAQAQAKYDIG